MIAIGFSVVVMIAAEHLPRLRLAVEFFDERIDRGRWRRPDRADRLERALAVMTFAFDVDRSDPESERGRERNTALGDLAHRFGHAPNFGGGQRRWQSGRVHNHITHSVASPASKSSARSPT